MVEGPYCSGCPQEAVGERRLLPDGRGSSGILIVGDSPWKDEIKQGRPFAGAAGAYLDRLIRLIGRKRDDFVITNTMCCKPQWLQWTDKPEAMPAITQCGPYLDETVRQLKPKAIIPLGNVALRRCCGVSGIQSRQAYLHESHWGIPAIPTFHPSFIMQGNHKYFGAAAFAFLKATEIANGKYPRLKQNYLLDPPLEAARAYFDQAGAEVACDIETPKTSQFSKDEADELDDSYNIIRVGFSHTPGTALSVVWSEPYVSLIREFMTKAKRWIFWNENYDVPRLRAAGMAIAGETFDAMWEWHFLQSDLLKGLDFVAPFFCDIPYWSDLMDSEPAYYNACDNDATLRCYLGITEALKRQGRYQAFETHCLRTGAILRAMGPRGILIDKAKQLALKERLEGEHRAKLAQLQLQVPEVVRNIKTWKKGPKEVLPEHRIEVVTCPKCGGSCGQSEEAKETQAVLPV